MQLQIIGFLNMVFTLVAQIFNDLLAEINSVFPQTHLLV